MVAILLAHALADGGFPPEMLQPILVDVNRAALEIAYRKKFPWVPVFFENLLKVYQAGRFPCGWTGSLLDWPAGNVIIF